MNKKALLIPHNSKHEFFLQDRRGYKAPEWGFFGGGVEKGETPLKAVLREAKEELDIELTEADLEMVGDFTIENEGEKSQRTIYLYRTDQDKFNVLEGAGGHWLGQGGAGKRLEEYENFPEILAAIEAMSA